MAAKTDMLSFGADIDIDALIEEGREKNRQVIQEAEMQAGELTVSAEKEGLDLTVEKIDMFKFQDQDFREVRKGFQQIIQQKQTENLAKLQVEGGYKRPQRAAAQNCIQHMRDEHKDFAKARTANAEKSRQERLRNSDYDPTLDIEPKKDKSI